MLIREQIGLKSNVSDAQLEWLCKLADWDMPQPVKKP